MPPITSSRPGARLTRTGRPPKSADNSLRRRESSVGTGSSVSSDESTVHPAPGGEGAVAGAGAGDAEGNAVGDAAGAVVGAVAGGGPAGAGGSSTIWFVS